MIHVDNSVPCDKKRVIESQDNKVNIKIKAIYLRQNANDKY